MIERFYREAVYLADRAEIDEKLKMVFTHSDFVNWYEFDETNKVVVGDITIDDRNDETFRVLIKKALIY